jgi:hypothetical protein
MAAYSRPASIRRMAKFSRGGALASKKIDDGVRKIRPHGHDRPRKRLASKVIT